VFCSLSLSLSFVLKKNGDIVSLFFSPPLLAHRSFFEILSCCVEEEKTVGIPSLIFVFKKMSGAREEGEKKETQQKTKHNSFF
jgi:hypothetical protein